MGRGIRRDCLLYVKAGGQSEKGKARRKQDEGWKGSRYESKAP